nr:tubulin--tyrosine ligase-like protein 12 [Aotus nancymaae]
MWKFNQTYQLAHGTAEEKMPVWYIMDEFSSRIQHADVPSFATAPFFYMPQQVAYTLLWPLRDLDTGEEVTRDFAYGETDPLMRKCMLLPWAPADMLDLSSCMLELEEDAGEALQKRPDPCPKSCAWTQGPSKFLEGSTKPLAEGPEGLS